MEAEEATRDEHLAEIVKDNPLASGMNFTDFNFPNPPKP